MLSTNDIRKEANKFMYEYGEPIFPFPIAELAELKGFAVKVFTPKMDKTYEVSGVIDYDNESIYVNEFDSPTRQRFTIAHELGHLALHKEQGNIVDFRDSIFNKNIFDPKETEANIFAAELLMPKEEFIQSYNKNPGAFFLLSLKFDVSALAVKIRIDNLTKEGCL